MSFSSMLEQITKDMQKKEPTKKEPAKNTSFSSMLEQVSKDIATRTPAKTPTPAPTQNVKYTAPIGPQAPEKDINYILKSMADATARANDPIGPQYPTTLQGLSKFPNATLEPYTKTLGDVINNMQPIKKTKAVSLGLLDFMTLGLASSLSNEVKDLKTFYEVNEPGASKLGEIAGYVVPGVGFSAAAGKVAKPLLKGLTPVAKVGVQEALAGLGMGVTEGIFRGEELGDIGKRALEYGAMGGIGGAALTKGGMALRELLSDVPVQTPTPRPPSQPPSAPPPYRPIEPISPIQKGGTIDDFMTSNQYKPSEFNLNTMENDLDKIIKTFSKPEPIKSQPAGIPQIKFEQPKVADFKLPEIPKLKTVASEVSEQTFPAIKTIDQLPSTVEGLENYIKYMQDQKNKGIKIDLQLFAEAEKKLKGLRLSKQYTNSFKNSFIEPNDYKKLSEEAFMYKPKQLDVAEKNALEDFLRSDHGDLESKILAKDLWTDEDVALSKLIANKKYKEYKNTGDISELQDFLSNIRPKGTKAGQTVNAYKVWKESAEGNIKKAIDMIEEAKTPEQIKQLEDVVKKDLDEITGKIASKIDEISGDIEKKAQDILGRNKVGDFWTPEDLMGKSKIPEKEYGKKLIPAKNDKAKVGDLWTPEDLIGEPTKVGKIYKKKITAQKIPAQTQTPVRPTKFGTGTGTRAPGTPIPRKPIDPAEILARKIKASVTQRTPKTDPMMEMISTLFKAAKESPINTKITPKKSAIEFIGQAIKGREQYKDVWNRAKKIFQREYGSLPATMNDVDKWINKGILPNFTPQDIKKASRRALRPPFSQEELRSAVKGGLKKFNIKWSNVIKDYYVKGDNAGKTLTNYLVYKAGLTGDQADALAKYVSRELRDMTKELAEKYKKNITKPVLPASEKDYIKDLVAYANVGLLKDPRFVKAMEEKLGSKLTNIIRQKKIDIGEIIKQGKNFVANERNKFLEDLAKDFTRKNGDLRINPKELKKILQAASDTFDDLVIKKKSEWVKRNFPPPAPPKQAKTLEQKLQEASALGLFDRRTMTQGLRNFWADRLKIPMLTDELADRIIIYSEELQTIPKKGFNNLVARDEIIAKMISDISRNIPSSKAKKIVTFQTIQQLLNQTTFLRNLGGNEVYYRTLRSAKYLETFLDASVTKIKGGDRVISLKKGTNFWKLYDAIYDQSPKFFKNVRKAGKEAYKGYSLYGVNDYKFGLNSPVFTAKWNPLTYAEKYLGVALKSFDYPAYMRGVRERVYEMADLLATNKGLKGVEKDRFIRFWIGNMTDESYKTATEFGKKLTFQNDSRLAVMMNNLKNALNTIGIGNVTRTFARVENKTIGVKEFGLGDILGFKYARTGGNILAAMLEFSPAGFLNATYKLLRGRGDKRRTIEILSRSTIGTGLLGMGLVLGKLGIITEPSPDDVDARELMESEGIGKARINISAMYRWIASGFNPDDAKLKKGDQLETIDWIVPGSASTLLGSNIGSKTEKTRIEKVVGGSVATFMDAVDSVADTMTDLSLIRSIKMTVNSYGNSADFFTNLFTNTATGFMGTWLNKIRQYTDTTQRNIKDPNPVTKTMNIIKNRIPGLSKTLPAKITTTGETAKLFEGGLNNPLVVFLNPGFLNEYKSTPGVNTILEIYSETGRTEHFPKKITQKNIEINGQKINLTEEQRNFLQIVIGQESMKRISDLENKPEFRSASSDTKIEIIVNILSDVGKIARDMLKYQIMQKQ